MTTRATLRVLPHPFPAILSSLPSTATLLHLSSTSPISARLLTCTSSFYVRLALALSLCKHSTWPSLRASPLPKSALRDSKHSRALRIGRMVSNAERQCRSQSLNAIPYSHNAQLLLFSEADPAHNWQATSSLRIRGCRFRECRPLHLQFAIQEVQVQRWILEAFQVLSRYIPVQPNLYTSVGHCIAVRPLGPENSLVAKHNKVDTHHSISRLAQA